MIGEEHVYEQEADHLSALFILFCWRHGAPSLERHYGRSFVPARRGYGGMRCAQHRDLLARAGLRKLRDLASCLYADATRRTSLHRSAGGRAGLAADFSAGGIAAVLGGVTSCV